MTPRRSLPRAAAALALYGALVAWRTWPLAAHLSTHLAAVGWACRFDPLAMAWALAYQSHALATAPWTLADGNIYAPTPHALFYGETGSGALPLFLPVFLLTGNPTLALNLTVLGGVALTAWVIHLVVRRWTGSSLGAFLAALAFLSTPWVLREQVPCAPSYAALACFPAIVFLASRPAPTFRAALVLLPLVVLQCLANPYVAVAVLVPLGGLAALRAARARTRAAGLRLLAVLGIAAAVLGLANLGQLAVRLENPGLAQQTFWRFTLTGQRLAFPSPRFWPDQAWAVPGAAVLLIAAGALVALVRRRREPPAHTASAWRHGAWWAASGFLLSITPTVVWYGTPIRTPLAALGDWLPIYQVIRVPARLGVAGLMGLTVLTGTAFAACEAGLAALVRPALARAVAGGLAAALAVAMWTGRGAGHAPYPIAAAIDGSSPLMPLLRRPGGPLLELPVAPYGITTPVPQARAMYRSIFHWRPLVNGYHGYWPAAFPERMRLAAELPDPRALAALRRATGLELILVHVRDLPPAERAAWLALAAAGGGTGLRLAGRDGDDLLFEVAAAGLS